MRVRTRDAATVAGLACVLVLAAACGSDRGSEEPAAPTTAAPAATSAPAPETPAADVLTIAVADRLGERLEVGGQPDYLAVAGDALWVKADSGHVVRVDPATSTVGEPIEVGDPRCQGLGGAGDVLWACADEEGGLVRLDPVTGEVVATLAAGKIAAQGSIPVAFGHAWILTGDGSTLVGVADDAVATTIALGTVCTQVAASATAIWAACPTDGMALRIDPVAGEVVARIPDLPNALAVAAGAQVWVGFDGGLARIDEARAVVTGTADAVADSRSGLAVTPDAVWVHNPGLFLRRIDPATGAVVEDVVTPEEDGGSVLVAFGSVWATASDDNVLYRLDPA